jgi:hypothetical protein
VQVGAIPIQRRGQRPWTREIGHNLIHIGMRRPRPHVGEIVGRQPLLGDALELEQQHVPRLLALCETNATECQRMTNRQRRQVIDTLRGECCHRPSKRRSPIVSDHMGALHSGRVEDAEDIADDVEHAVALDLAWLRRFAKAAQIGDDDAIAGSDKFRNLVAP